jgi:hypothetical protein
MNRSGSKVHTIAVLLGVRNARRATPAASLDRLLDYLLRSRVSFSTYELASQYWRYKDLLFAGRTDRLHWLALFQDLGLDKVFIV